MDKSKLDGYRQLAIEARRMAYKSTSGIWEKSHASLFVSGKYSIDEWFVRLLEGDTAIASDISNPIDGSPSEGNAEFIAFAHNEMERMANVITELVVEISTFQSNELLGQSERWRL